MEGSTSRNVSGKGFDGVQWEYGGDLSVDGVDSTLFSVGRGAS